MPPSPQQRLEVDKLIDRIATSRDSIEIHARELRRKLDLPSRIKQSILSKPLAWFGGSLGAGFVASRLLRRPKKEKKSGGWIVLIFGSLFTLAKPILKNVITSELQRRFMDHAGPKNTSPETRLPLPKPPI